MTDDLTRPIETPAAAESAATEAAPGAAEQQSTAAQKQSTAAAQQPTPAPQPPAPAGTEPAVTAPAPGANRMRWAIGLGVAGLAVAVAIGAFILLGSRPAPSALQYIPADAALVVEVRMDLPGDQLQKLGNLLAHFPGFADQSTLPAKIDESLTRILQQSGSGDIDYVRDLKPWLSGPTFIALRVPASAGSGSTSMDRGVVSATTTGTVTCETPFKGQSVTRETYRGLELSIGSNGDAACVIDGRQALIGDVASVHDALDARANGSGIDRSADYDAARAALQGDQLATVFFNGKAYGTLLSDDTGSATTPMADLSLLTGSVPDWAMTGIRAEDDALVVDTVSAPARAAAPGATPGPSLLPLPPTHPSAIAPLAPATTIVYAEAQGAGVGLQNLLTRFRSLPDLATAFQMLDGMGGAGQLVGWVDDAGIIVVNGGTLPSGGVALVATDDEAAADKLRTLTGLLGLLGLGNNSIQTHATTIAGVTVTTITISDIGALVPPSQLPSGMQIPSDAKVEFSLAAKGRVLLLGSGEDFMTAVLNTTPGSSLADQAAYKRATSRALSNSRGTLYVGIHDIVGLAETFLSADEKARWESDLKPYVAPFQALSITSTTDASGDRSRLTITVSKP